MHARHEPTPRGAAPRDEAWLAALASAQDAQALAEGTSAYLADRYDDALPAFATASCSSAADVASIAGFNRGVVLGDLGRWEEAVAAYDEVIARFADAPEPALREQVARTLVNNGAMLGVGRSEEAAGVYDEVIARFAYAPEPALREQVASTLRNKGATLGVLGRWEEAVGVYGEVIAGSRTRPAWGGRSGGSGRGPLARILDRGWSLRIYNIRSIMRQT